MKAYRQPGLSQWLLNHIRCGTYPGLKWRNKKNLEFSISWRHGSSRQWSQIDVALFRDWAIYKKKFQRGKIENILCFESRCDYFFCMYNYVPLIKFIPLSFLTIM